MSELFVDISALLKSRNGSASNFLDADWNKIHIFYLDMALLKFKLG